MLACGQKLKKRVVGSDLSALNQALQGKIHSL